MMKSVLPGFHPDPSIYRVGEDQSLVTSAFDPALFWDDDGRLHITYFTDAGLLQSTLDLETGKLLQPSRRITTSMIGKYPAAFADGRTGRIQEIHTGISP